MQFCVSEAVYFFALALQDSDWTVQRMIDEFILNVAANSESTYNQTTHLKYVKRKKQMQKQER